LPLAAACGSNLPAAADILAATGEKYSGKFLQGAERAFEALRSQIPAPEVEFNREVCLRATGNGVPLALC